jgi:hypothetical protein
MDYMTINDDRCSVAANCAACCGLEGVKHICQREPNNNPLEYHWTTYYHPDELENTESAAKDFERLSREGWRLCSMLIRKHGAVIAFYQREELK